MTDDTCSRPDCTDPLGRIDNGGGMQYCSHTCENKALRTAARKP